MMNPTVTVEFVNMGAYNQLHFPGLPSGGLGDLFVYYAYMKVVLFLFTMTRGTVRNDLWVRVTTAIGTFKDRNQQCVFS